MKQWKAGVVDERWKEVVVKAEKTMAQQALNTLLYILTDTGSMDELTAMSGKQIVNGIIAYRDRHEVTTEVK